MPELRAYLERLSHVHRFEPLFEHCELCACGAFRQRELLDLDEHGDAGQPDEPDTPD